MAAGRFLVDTIPAQHEGLRQVLQDFPADVIVADDMYYGALPMLLGPRANRPPIVICGASILRCPRDDGAPDFEGLPPATTQAQRDEYAAWRGSVTTETGDAPAPSREQASRRFGCSAADDVSAPIDR